MKVTRVELKPGETFLGGGSGVILLRGIKPKSPKTKPKDVEKDSKEDDK